MSKSFFFGFHTVYDWEWLWGRTAAQIELRTIDQPIIVYKKESSQDGKKQPWQNGTATADYAKQQYEIWKARQNAEKKKGIKVSLSNFIATAGKQPAE